MKQLIIGFIIVSAITFTACNDNENKSGNENISEMKEDSITQPSSKDENVKELTPTFTNVDAKTTGYIKNIIDHYLHIKNALASDNESEASSGAMMLSQSLAKVDKSYFTPEQKSVYDKNEEGLEEHAALISKSKIDIQREHFSMLSEDVYSLVKGLEVAEHCIMITAQWPTITKVQNGSANWRRLKILTWEVRCQHAEQWKKK